MNKAITSDKYWCARYHAAEVLGNANFLGKSIQVLNSVAKNDADHYVRLACYSSLSNLPLDKHPDLVDFFISILNSQQSPIQQERIALCLGKPELKSNNSVINALIHLTSASKVKVAAAAMKSLSKLALDRSDVLNIMTNSLTSNSSNRHFLLIRKSAAEILGDSSLKDNPMVINTLVTTLKNEPQREVQIAVG